MKFNQALIASMVLILPSVSVWDVRCYSEHGCSGEEGTLVYAPDDDIGMPRFRLNVEGRKSCRFNKGASQSILAKQFRILRTTLQDRMAGNLQRLMRIVVNEI
ncbi:hypothetical protein FGRMN_1434 [Fusarium graminum]|nr:hypothetical protein FGRMN_1434 [Fusarium graminum]